MQVDITPTFNMANVKRTSKAASSAIDKAIVSALNKIAAQGLTGGRKAITTKYNIKASDIKPAITLLKARKSNPVAIIRARGAKALPLFKFGGLPKAPVSQAGIKAPYRGRRKASAKVLKKGKREKLRHAFVAKLGGNVSIYERVGSKRLPVRKVMSLGIPVMFEHASVHAIEDYVKAQGQQIFEHELGHYLKKVSVK